MNLKQLGKYRILEELGRGGTWRRIVGAALVGIAIIITLASCGSEKLPIKPYLSPVQTMLAAPAKTMPPAPTQTLAITETPIPTEMPTNTLAPTFTLTRALGIGSTRTRPADGMTMVYVPEGTFTMGDTVDQAMGECQKFRNDCQQSWFTDEQPPHDVSMDGYWIDKTEVTNVMYAKCLGAGACQAPSSIKSHTFSSYYGNPQYDHYPAIYVSWADASNYCTWAGVRLPTEAEWEKAARGTDGRIYPWGNDSPSKSLLNYNSNVGDTTATGNSLPGASPFGAVDMAGNVWEWVNDWFGETYYSQSPQSNPQGPSSGISRVLRGGSWVNDERKVRSAYRVGVNPAEGNGYVGFRCAQSAQP